MNARGYYIYPRLAELEHVSPVILILWEHLLSHARYKEGDGLAVGQIITSVPELRKSLFWVSGYRTEYFSIDQIKRALKYLKRNLINIVRKGKKSLITIKNYLNFSDPKWIGYSSNKNATGAPNISHGRTEQDNEKTNDINEMSTNEKQRAHRTSLTGAPEKPEKPKKPKNDKKNATGAPENIHGRTEQSNEIVIDYSWLEDVLPTGAPTGAPNISHGRTEQDNEKTNDINEMSTNEKQRAHRTSLTGAPMGAPNEDFCNRSPFLLDLNKENKIGNKKTLRPLSKTLKKTPKIIPYEKIVSLYHEILPELPKIRKTGKLLKSKIKKIWESDKDYQSIEFWREYFEIVSKSDWLCGKVKEWRASLQWLLKPEKFENVYNGVFNNPKNLSSDLMRHNMRAGDRFMEIQAANEAARKKREAEGRAEL